MLFKERNDMHPCRLVAAREIRGISKAAMAEYLRCSASYYSEIERGHKSGGKYWRWICEYLGFSSEFFAMSKVKNISNGSFTYRKKSSMKLPDRKAVESLGSVLATDMLGLKRRFMSVSHHSVPNLDLLHQRCTAPESAEVACQIIRDRFSMGSAPLRSAIDLVEALGVHVFWCNGPTELDGVSFWVDGEPFIMLNRSLRDGYRARFTTLHELAHLIFDRNNLEIGKVEDRRADCFASAMLMPTATFRTAACRNLVLLNLLEDRMIWGASVRAQVRRMHDLGLISDWAYRDAFIRMNQMWGTLEPSPASPEQSLTHKFMFDEAGDRGEYAECLAAYVQLPYDLFLDALPCAREYERASNKIPSW